MKQRCAWCYSVTKDQDAYIQYHDQEWGRPLYDDRSLFEFLILEGVQAGLSWATVLKKREHYRKAYDNFDPEKVARYSLAKQQSLLENPGLIRNRLKIKASITNAKAFLKVKETFGTFAAYLWEFVDESPIQNRWRTLADVPTRTPISEAMSKDLKKKGFTFVGSTICYAYMQAIGMVNDHTTDCFLHEHIKNNKAERIYTA